MELLKYPLMLSPELVRRSVLVLQQHQDEILQRWILSLDQLPAGTLRKELSNNPDQFIIPWLKNLSQNPDNKNLNPSEILRNNVQEIFDVIWQTLKTGKDDAVEAYIQKVSLEQVKQGIDIQEVIEAIFLAGEAAMPALRSGFESEAEAQLVTSVFERTLHSMVARFGSIYAQAMRQDQQTLAEDNARLLNETRQRLAETQSMQQVTAALLMKVELKDAMQVVCSEAQKLTHSAGSTVYLGSGNDGLKIVYSTDPSLAAKEAISNPAAAASRVYQSGRPLMIHNVADLASEQRPNLINLLCVPFQVKNEIKGVLEVVNRPQGYSALELQTLELFSDQAALAYESTRLHVEVERLAVMEERQRLSRELHDSVTQELYGMTLYAEAANRLMAAGNLNESANYLHELRLTAQEALCEMRLLIFQLRPPILEKVGLIAALQERLEAVEGRAGLKADFHVEGEQRLPPAIEEALYRIAVEALNNSLKHAHAQHIQFNLHMSPAQVHMQIKDDGVGFDPQTGIDSAGMGLNIMQDRCEKINAQLLIHSAPQQGAEISVILPLKGENQ
mgnify:CR=1 FL=1